MDHAASWRLFRRMQDTIFAVAALVYAAAVIHAWRVLPGGAALKSERTLVFPGFFLILSFFAALFVPVVRLALCRHLWISYQTGFGQSVISVIAGVGVLILVAGFIFWQVQAATHGGRYPAGAFSGYAAGIGLLAAQAVLTRKLQRDARPRVQSEDAERR